MDNRPVAGVDISKNFSDMCILSAENEIIGKLHFEHDFNGLTKAADMLLSIKEKYKTVPIIVMESTSHYHRLLFYFMKERGFEVIVINPLQSNAIKNIEIRKVKSDSLDAYRIALLYRLKELRITNDPIDALFDIRNLTRQHLDLVQARTMYINRLISDLDQAFPHFHKIFPKLSTNTVLELLSQYCAPADFLAAGREKLVSLIRKTSRHGEDYAEKKVDKIIESAEQDNLINIKCGSSAFLIRSNVCMIRTINDNLKIIENEIKRLVSEDESVKEDVALLDSIPGISTFSAAVILSEVGNFKAFSKPTQLVAYFGLDPSTRQSGMFKGTKNKITKRGCRYLRGVLNMTAISSISKNSTGNYNNLVLAEFYKSKTISKPHKVALCAVMNKLVHIIFAVMRDRKPFELRKPEDHAKWLNEKNGKKDTKTA